MFTALARFATLGWLSLVATAVAWAGPAPQATASQPAVTGPGNPEPPAEQAGPQLTPMRRGDILMARRMYREAIEAYSQGVKDIAVLFNKIGIAYHQLGDLDNALRHYQKALEIDPQYAEAINNIGTVYYARKKYKEAIGYYERALKFAPKSASIYSNLGTAYFARKKYKEALEAYQKALELDPEVFERRNTAGVLLQERSVEERAKFHFYLAKMYARAGDVERALRYMRMALEEGFKDKDQFRKDPDFAKLQDLQEFQALLAMEPKAL